MQLCFQQSCVLGTETAKTYAVPWLSSRFHPQHKNLVLELAAKADLAPVAIRLAWGAGLCQVAARLREEMAFHELMHGIVPGRLELSQVVLIILLTSLTCYTSPTWFLTVPIVGVCGQAVPCAPAEHLVCSGDARQKAGVLCVPTNTCPAAAPRALGFCTGKATGVLVPQRARAVGRAHVCASVWEAGAECAASTGHQAVTGSW